MLPLRMLGPLMLMFLLCDADSLCPSELNPVLDPPHVIGEYGTSVLVNCTSPDDNHEGMYWRVDETTSDTEDEEGFISKMLSLSDWNVTAECRIQLNVSSECSEGLEITIFKNPANVFMFPTRDAYAVVEGTPYELRCVVQDVAPVQNLTVRWYKNSETVMIDSFTSSTTKIPVDQSSTLTVNISRGESGAQFRCEAQLDFGPHGPQPPVMHATQPVYVHYAPELKNNIDIEDVSVDEGADVSLTCEAEGNPPPVFNWNCDGVNMLVNMNILNIAQVITSRTCECTATNYVGNTTKQIHVQVIKTTTTNPAATTAPEAPSQQGCPLVLTPAEVVVRFGDPVSVNCTTTATDALKMGWETTSGGTGSEHVSAVTWTVEELKDWTVDPKCFVTLEDKQCQVSLAITLYKTPDIVSLSGLERGPMVEGQEYQLKCDIIKVAPVQKLEVKWYRGSEMVHAQMFNDTSVTPVNVSSTLKVIPERDYNGALFRCQAELHLGPKGPELIPTARSPPYPADVLYKPLIRACPDRYTGVENEFSLDMLPCKADGKPSPTVQWYYQGKPVNASERLTRTQSGEYTADVVNSLGMSKAAITITIEYLPSFTCVYLYEVQEDDQLQTMCEPKGMPPPVVTLIKGGKEVKAPQRWTKNDRGEYLVRATNKHGTAHHLIYLNVLYAPLISGGDVTMGVTPGQNVTFNCTVEGNPPPLISWQYTPAVNVMETTGGRHNTISITGATSTNDGVYNCVATNEVGSVTRSFSLIVQGHPSVLKLGNIRVFLIPAIFISIILIIIIYHNRRKKHRKYSFVPDNAKDSSDIPLTPKSGGVQA
ncbi:intercellular adhesion molecule 5 isoform X2 [Chelmon rostratus]|uniref:intercellular adhesion molecule 5 isoform X2 n=1 Tax=Chelmon rostratus TaxID=109905 RepID=UPI001BE81A9C|nr:intercellular adhesion molecule 5 isoform X2 [Chelmon rostratus]